MFFYSLFCLFVCLIWEGTIESYWINWQTFDPVPHVMIFALSLSLWGVGRSFHFCLFCLQFSVTCDSGIKVRSVECSDKDFSCDARTKPQTTAQCNVKPCPRWKTSPWGEVNCYLKTPKIGKTFFTFHQLHKTAHEVSFYGNFCALRKRNKAFPHVLPSAMFAAMLVSFKNQSRGGGTLFICKRFLSSQ